MSHFFSEPHTSQQTQLRVQNFTHDQVHMTLTKIYLTSCSTCTNLTNMHLKTICFSVILTSLAMLTIGCEKDANDADTTMEIEVVSGETIEHFLGAMSFEGGYLIHEQANHFEVSEIENLFWDGVFYRYKSREGFIGQDKVVIESRLSPGDSTYTSHFIELIIHVD